MRCDGDFQGRCVASGPRAVDRAAPSEETKLRSRGSHYRMTLNLLSCGWHGRNDGRLYFFLKRMVAFSIYSVGRETYVANAHPIGESPHSHIRGG